jgi:valyl-tRNA synthetase
LPDPRAAKESVCIAAWPAPLGWSDQTARTTVEQWCEAIKAIRNLRADRDVPKEAKVKPIIVAAAPVAGMLRQGERFLRSLPPAESVTILDAGSAFDRPAECAVAVLPDAEILLPLAGLIDKEAEVAKHRKTLADLERQIGGQRAKLANESFVARAPADGVEQARSRLAELEAQREAVLALIR